MKIWGCSIIKTLAYIMFMKQKYPRTKHLPHSPGATSDDKILKDVSCFEGKTVIITEKMDGENCLDFSTILQTPDGEVSLGYLCENDSIGCKVLGYNTETNNIEYCDVLGKKIGKKCLDWYKIELEDGTVLIATGNHRVYLPLLECYRKIVDLEGDDELLKK